MTSRKSEKLYPFIPLKDDTFPGSVLMRGLEVSGGIKLLQYYYFSKAFCTCSCHGTTTEHLSEEQFRYTKRVSVAALSTQSHQGPSYACSSAQECSQEGAVIKASWLYWKWDSGQRSEALLQSRTPRVCANGARQRWAEYSWQVWISVLLQVTSLRLHFFQCEIMFICI